MSGIGQELLAVPFPEMVVKLAGAVAEGQYKLDIMSIEIAKLMAKTNVMLPDVTNSDADAFIEVSMLNAGFMPTFYQFTDTIIEVKMAISMTKTRSASASVTAKGGWGPVSVSVNASYSSKYSYSVEGSSLIRTKITPVPPNPFMTKLYEMKSTILQKEQMKVMEEKESELEKEDNERQEKALGAAA